LAHSTGRITVLISLVVISVQLEDRERVRKG
jgi:hypothetical protein